jgi:hypothetical protein
VIFLCSQARKDSGLNFMGLMLDFRKYVSLPEYGCSVNA